MQNNNFFIKTSTLNFHSFRKKYIECYNLEIDHHNRECLIISLKKLMDILTLILVIVLAVLIGGGFIYYMCCGTHAAIAHLDNRLEQNAA